MDEIEGHKQCDVNEIEGYGATMCTTCFSHADDVLTPAQKVELIATYPPAERKSRYLKDNGATWGF